MLNRVAAEDKAAAAVAAEFEALLAAADRVRLALGEFVELVGVRRVSEDTGLAHGTVQRWCVEVPPTLTLSKARQRRGKVSGQA